MNNSLGRFNSRIATNSFPQKEVSMAFPFRNQGPSFGGLSWSQYSYLVYHELANNGAGAGARGARWARTNGQEIAFNPPR